MPSKRDGSLRRRRETGGGGGSESYRKQRGTVHKRKVGQSYYTRTRLPLWSKGTRERQVEIAILWTGWEIVDMGGAPSVDTGRDIHGGPGDPLGVHQKEFAQNVLSVYYYLFGSEGAMYLLLFYVAASAAHVRKRSGGPHLLTMRRGYCTASPLLYTVDARRPFFLFYPFLFFKLLYWIILPSLALRECFLYIFLRLGSLSLSSSSLERGESCGSMGITKKKKTLLCPDGILFSPCSQFPLLFAYSFFSTRFSILSDFRIPLTLDSCLSIRKTGFRWFPIPKGVGHPSHDWRILSKFQFFLFFFLFFLSLLDSV